MLRITMLAVCLILSPLARAQTILPEAHSLDEMILEGEPFILPGSYQFFSCFDRELLEAVIGIENAKARADAEAYMRTQTKCFEISQTEMRVVDIHKGYRLRGDYGEYNVCVISVVVTKGAKLEEVREGKPPPAPLPKKPAVHRGGKAVPFVAKDVAAKPFDGVIKKLSQGAAFYTTWNVRSLRLKSLCLPWGI